jgi:putative ABC transport system ATP-binding protein
MLTVNAIRKTFNPGTPNEVRALQGVTLTIPTASFVVVIGTNGSGKSTLLNALAGTFLVDDGSIVVDGTDVTRWPNTVGPRSSAACSRTRSAARRRT